MNWKIPAVCISLALAGFCNVVSAQQAVPPGQHIPAEAKKAVLEFPGDGQVTLNGKPVRLSAAVQIRGTTNLIVLSQSLRGKYLARVLLDNAGAIHRAWIMNPDQ
ncbi:MAG: hypothetical protein JWL63_566 [Rhodocyclales bacterium]|nr:hypothetical protein [Rhodocyclales bacterium]